MIVLDLPNGHESTNRTPSDRERCAYLAENFFESVPEGADVYLLSGIVHHWEDRAVTVLRNCREAMTKEGRVLLVEMIVPDTNSASFSKLLDLNMLVVTGGGSGQDLSIAFLLDAADYRVDRIIPPMARQSVIEAIPNSVDREESVHRVNYNLWRGKQTPGRRVGSAATSEGIGYARLGGLHHRSA